MLNSLQRLPIIEKSIWLGIASSFIHTSVIITIIIVVAAHVDAMTVMSTITLL